VIIVDEPSLSVTIGINTSPAGRKERRQADRDQLKARLERDSSGRVAAGPRERASRMSGVPGPRRLALAVLVELMRREAFELTVETRRS